MLRANAAIERSCMTGRAATRKLPQLTSGAALLLGLLFVFGTCFAQVVPPRNLVIHSHSGQFAIQAVRLSRGKPPSLDLLTDTNYVKLEPAFVSVSCERIKQILMRELDTTAPWHDEIAILLFPASAEDSSTTLVSDHFRNGWHYRLEMPDLIERHRYVEAVVQAILLEMANRTAGTRSAEIPLWLSTGFARRLLATAGPEIILTPPAANPNVNLVPATFKMWRNENPLEEAHKQFTEHPALNFEQLSWPMPDQLKGDAGALYANSAQLFLTQLLSLKDGPASLRETLANLPQYYNWQLAFLRGFHDSFTRPLDVEKWWTLQVMHFTGRDLTQSWTLSESWQKLALALSVAVQVRSNLNDLPIHSEVTLQTVLTQWDRAHQNEALQSKVSELGLLALRAAREFGPLIEAYRQTLADFLQERDKSGFIIPLHRQSAFRKTVAEAVKRLNELDARLAAMKPSEKPITAQNQP